MKDWKEFRFGEVCEVTSSKRVFLSDYVKEGVPFYRSKEVIEKFNGNEISVELYISKEQYQKFKSKFGVPLKDDILLTSVGTIGVPYKVKENEFFYFKDGNLTWIKKYKKDIDPSFLFQWIRSEIGQKTIQQNLIGSSQPALTIDAIKKLKIHLPSITAQRRIASILSAYDDLIEVNNQRIKLLEETARELYKEWFVRMRFPGHKKAKFMKGFPKEWNIKPIGKVIDYYIGGGWGNDIQDNQFATSGYVIRGTDIPGVRIGKANREVYRFHKTSNMKSRELIEGDIVFETAGGSEGQPLGRTCYITQELLDSYGDKVMAASFCKQIRTTSMPPLYLYYYLNYLYDTGMIEAFQVQSTGISNYQFEPFLKYQEIILPDDDLMQQFHDKTLIMQKQIALLGEQNTQLRQIRDRLLPRLISGKLELK